MSALAGGADNAYIPEVPFDVFSISEDVKKLIEKFKRGNMRGIVVRNENANPYYTTSFLQNIYEGQSENNYICRTNILGESCLLMYIMRSMDCGRYATFHRVPVWPLAF